MPADNLYNDDAIYFYTRGFQTFPSPRAPIIKICMSFDGIPLFVLTVFNVNLVVKEDLNHLLEILDF